MTGDAGLVSLSQMGQDGRVQITGRGCESLVQMHMQDRVFALGIIDIQPDIGKIGGAFGLISTGGNKKEIVLPSTERTALAGRTGAEVDEV